MTNTLSLRAMVDLEEQVAAAMFDGRLFVTPQSPRWDKAHPEAREIFLAHARSAIAVCQSSWANEKAEMERRLLRPPETKAEREKRFMEQGLCWCGCKPGFCPH